MKQLRLDLPEDVIPDHLMPQREQHVRNYAKKGAIDQINDAIPLTCKGETALDTFRRLRGEVDDSR